MNVIGADPYVLLDEKADITIAMQQAIRETIFSSIFINQKI